MLLKELSKKLKLSLKDDFIGIQNEIDIGDITFTDYERVGKHIVKFTNRNDPNIILINNRMVIAIVLYKLDDSELVIVTSWVNNTLRKKIIPKSRIKPEIINNG